MQQLPLPVRLRTSSVFSGYIAGPNSAVVQSLYQQQFTASPLVFIYGQVATGKTHLLQALCVEAAHRQQIAVYFHADDLVRYGPELLNGSAQYSFVCIDDVDAVLEQRPWNHALFNVYRELEESGGKLIMSATRAPASYSMPLADFRSRVMGGMSLHLQSLNELEQLEALRLHASQRGLELPDETIHYLQRRLPRDMASLCKFLDELDIASLAAQRKLTVPFVKQVLDSR
jgi:DnaA family protein